jgi:hypothetical protein
MHIEFSAKAICGDWRIITDDKTIVHAEISFFYGVVGRSFKGTEAALTACRGVALQVNECAGNPASMGEAYLNHGVKIKTHSYSSDYTPIISHFLTGFPGSPQFTLKKKKIYHDAP